MFGGKIGEKRTRQKILFENNFDFQIINGIQLSALPPRDCIKEPKPPIHANIPPEMNIDMNRIEIYLCLIAGTIPKTIPNIAPENPPVINPYFITSQ